MGHGHSMRDLADNVSANRWLRWPLQQLIFLVQLRVRLERFLRDYREHLDPASDDRYQLDWCLDMLRELDRYHAGNPLERDDTTMRELRAMVGLPREPELMKQTMSEVKRVEATQPPAPAPKPFVGTAAGTP